jgi:hypothetical protein
MDQIRGGIQLKQAGLSPFMLFPLTVKCFQVDPATLQKEDDSPPASGGLAGALQAALASRFDAARNGG